MTVGKKEDETEVDTAICNNDHASLSSNLQDTSNKKVTTTMVGEQFDFKENSKAMFDDVCNASPNLVRHFTRSALTKGLMERGCGAVYESTMYEVCKEVTPAKYLKQTLDILEKDRTTTAPGAEDSPK